MEDTTNTLLFKFKLMHIKLFVAMDLSTSINVVKIHYFDNSIGLCIEPFVADLFGKMFDMIKCHRNLIAYVRIKVI